MDATLLYLIAGFALSALYFEFRVRRFVRRLTPLALERVLGAFLVKNVSKAEDGTEREIWAVSARGKALVAAVMPAVIAETVAWARKNVHLKGPAGGGLIPGGADLSSLMDPAVIAAGLQKVLPKEAKPFAGILGQLVQNFAGSFLGGGKPKPNAPTDAYGDVPGPGR